MRAAGQERRANCRTGGCGHLPRAIEDCIRRVGDEPDAFEKPAVKRGDKMVSAARDEYGWLRNDWKALLVDFLASDEFRFFLWNGRGTGGRLLRGLLRRLVRVGGCYG